MQNHPVCLIVGAGYGLGAGLAEVFGQAGYTVVMARRDGQAAQQWIDGRPDLAGRVLAKSVDATDPVQVQALFDAVEREVGAIDVVIFNVGYNVRAGVLETEPKLFERLWRLGTYAGFLVGREAARVMQPRGKGTVIFTGATASIRGGNQFGAFAAAKNGLRAFAQSMAREFGPQGLHVAHTVIDGGIDSERIRTQQPDRVAKAGEDGLLNPTSIAQAYLALHQQSRDAWTFELDLRPWAERW